MFFSLFTKNNECIEKEMDVLTDEKAEKDKKVEKYLYKKLKELYDIYNI